MGTLTHETAVSRARDIADRVLALLAAQNDKAGRLSTEAVDALGRQDLLGLMVPTEAGGPGLGPRTFAAVTATLAEADATVAPTLQEIAAGRHLTALAFSEAGSRSHFWTPIARARQNGTGARPINGTSLAAFVPTAIAK